MMWLGEKVDRCCPMKILGEEEVGVNVERQCRVLEFDHTQPGDIHFLFSVGFFIIIILFYYKCIGVQWLWMADNLRN